ncbi:MAG: glutamate 5-kinase [Parcubacteria group bacterium CG11_big_fil_rev_8_21_14_0_20_41_14]|nr:MAG: glutamate 5-kinase [Parcubacteria group bacterium CG11_big_fil_rev_8_21_14_0_20_41_14]
MKKLVIKIGSQLLTDKQMQLNQIMIESIAVQVAELLKSGKQVVLVSSGAVASGRSAKTLIGPFSLVPDQQDPDLLREQILAAVGQPRLMRVYRRMFEKQNPPIEAAQLLVTRADFADRKRYVSLRTVVENLVRLGIVPIFNENDVLSTEELDFSDNDQLACMVSAMIDADLLLTLTDVPGLLDKHPDEGGKLIKQVENPESVRALAHPRKKKEGVVSKGGMLSKIEAADLITKLGIPMRIASGYEDKVITRIAAQDENVGTLFPVHGRKLSRKKIWISAGAAVTGRISVSTFLADRLRKKHVASILLRGVESLGGEEQNPEKKETFTEGDVVEVLDMDGTVLGKGQVRMGADELRDAILAERAKNSAGTRTPGGEKIVIHYDYFVFS